MIEPCVSLDHPGWLQLREALWPHCSSAEHLDEMKGFLSQPRRFAQFVFRTEQGQPVGLAEASIRTDYVNGAKTFPVAFLEGIYVVPASRRLGVAKSLVGAVSRWALERGCRELVSDALLENVLSHAVHQRLGFGETERVVYFRKVLCRDEG